MIFCQLFYSRALQRYPLAFPLSSSTTKMGGTRRNGRLSVALSVVICSLFQLSAVAGAEQEWTPLFVKETLDDWARDYPQIIRVTSAQEMYGIPRAGEVDDCPYEDEDGCSQLFFTIQDFVTHPDGSESSAHLPEVFWSGTLHGDETLGPSVVMEAASMLLESAACEAKPGPQPDLEELGEAEACRLALEAHGIDTVRRQWLARLVSTRRIVVVPSANSLGYYSNSHEEGQIDPARDFAYDKKIEPTKCMRSTAARAINEIFRDHMFQVAVSFHSGDGAVGFPWRKGDEPSPDKKIQLQLAKAFSRTVSGTFIYEEERSPNTLFENSDTLFDYATGAGSNEFKKRRGSFEDWAYAASWDHYVNSCTPTTFGGYPIEKTRYNNSTNRALAMFASINDGNKHENTDTSMKANVRLALASADLVQPYVNVLGVNNLALSDDIVPLTEGATKSCLQTKSVITSSRDDSLTVEWTVGGALNVDYTQLFYAKNLDIDSEAAMDCLLQPDDIDLSVFQQAPSLRKPGGSGFYSEPGPDPSPDESSTKKGQVLGPVFKAEIDLGDLSVGDRIVVIATARVDQNWHFSHGASNSSAPNPESHLANARTNPSWYHEHAGKRIKGRINWFSVPVTIILQDFDDKLGTMEVYDRFDQDIIVGGHENNEEGPILTSSVNDFAFMKVIWQAIVALISMFAILVVLIHQMKGRSLTEQIQSVLHAEREHRLRQHPSFADDPVEEEIIDFDNEGIYRKRTGTPRASATRNDLIDFESTVYDKGEDNPEYSPPDEFETIRIV
jgi:hypothetical protein